jgi:hypothetical protein
MTSMAAEKRPSVAMDTAFAIAFDWLMMVWSCLPSPQMGRPILHEHFLNGIGSMRGAYEAFSGHAGACD